MMGEGKQDSPGVGGENHVYDKEKSPQSTLQNSDISSPGEISLLSIKNYYLPRDYVCIIGVKKLLILYYIQSGCI